jgi:predicted type IV restriction endonuclease
METPHTIEELVERFRENREDYKAATYKEFRLRKEFIDPFFECLGWDLANKSSHAEAYKDVVHEDSIKIGDARKAPDYAFRIGGTRKFFVETKAPSVALKDNPEPAYQLRRYGWSAKLQLSILTNFAEFAVYDCRSKPDKADKASKGRILYFTFEEYRDCWPKIAEIFSKQAILKGAFDRFAEDATKKRGTSEVDTAFLAEIEGWRETLARNIALRNSVSVRELNTAVQRTIDRLIFLRIAEDRGFEQYGRLRELTRQKDVYSRLSTVFRQADARYNSGLFHFTPGDGLSETLDTFTLDLTVDDGILKDILRSLYYPDSPYEFGVFPPDILGQVYEQFLGKVIRLHGKSAIVEDKPEIKKAGGVFYTPTFVVRYIVNQVLSPLLDGKTPAQIGGLDKRTRSAAPLRVLDPACGSGSFLIEAYQHLLDWYLSWYVNDGPEKYIRGKAPKLYKIANGEWRLAILERRRILLAHIYGVDIDPQAVEVSKLSLLLKVLENEKADLLAVQMNLFHMRALPDLGDNIKCGNSLIAHDFYESPQPTLFSEEERIKVNAFDWEAEFGFRFDAVIGNPPYGGDYTEAEKVFFQSKYSYKRGKPETYLFFLEQGLQLLSPGGLLGFIVPNAWLTNFYGFQMRALLLQQSSVDEVADMEPVKVFKAATVDTCITILRNMKPNPQTKIAVTRVGPDLVIRPYFKIKQSQWRADDDKIFNVYASATELKIMAKMEGSKESLKSILDYSQGAIPYKTKEDGKKNLYIATQPKGATWKPLLESASQVEQYRVAKPSAFINYGNWLWCARDPKYFNQPKILFHRLRKKLPRQLIGAIDTSKAVNRHALSNLILRQGHEEDELWGILALFNSDLVNWWFIKKYGPLMEVGGFKVEEIPLPHGWPKLWPFLAIKARSIAEALQVSVSVKDEQRRAILEREAKSHRKAVEKRLAKGYGLSEDEAIYVTVSLHKLVDRFRPEDLPIYDEDEVAS